MTQVLRAVDKANGYCFGDLEERNLQAMMSAAVGADFQFSSYPFLAAVTHVLQSDRTVYWRKLELWIIWSMTSEELCLNVKYALKCFSWAAVQHSRNPGALPRNQWKDGGGGSDGAVKWRSPNGWTVFSSLYQERIPRRPGLNPKRFESSGDDTFVC